ncbi:hypothetical protein ACK346_04595 [Aeromonas veronii]
MLFNVLDNVTKLFSYNTRRVLIWCGSISALISITTFLFYDINLFISDFLNIKSIDNSLPIGAFLASIFSFSLLYLQGGDNFYTAINEHNTKSYIEIKFKSLDERVNKISETLAESKHDENNIEYNQEEIKNEVINKLGSDTIKSIFMLEAKRFEASVKKNIETEVIGDVSSGIKDRLYREISDLRLRANINLLIGMTITLIGLFALYDMVKTAENMYAVQMQILQIKKNDIAVNEIILSLVPRATFVIFIEIFAYFFLRLYKQGLTEIKYFQNELTNVESKITALKVAYIKNDAIAISNVIDALSKTERNFILNKDQTTIEIEKTRLDTETTKGLMSMLQNIIKK